MSCWFLSGSFLTFGIRPSTLEKAASLQLVMQHLFPNPITMDECAYAEAGCTCSKTTTLLFLGTGLIGSTQGRLLTPTDLFHAITAGIFIWFLMGSLTHQRWRDHFLSKMGTMHKQGLKTYLIAAGQAGRLEGKPMPWAASQGLYFGLPLVLGSPSVCLVCMSSFACLA